MVERPIKRAELEARRAAEAANPSPEGASTEAQSGEPRRAEKRDNRDSRDSRDSRGKGGKRGFDNDSKPSAVNLALVRGPKPQKAKPEPEPEPEVVEEPIVDTEADSAGEASEAPAEAAAAPEAAAE
jgi:hypothetical protein